MCSLKFSLESRAIPRTVDVLLTGTSVPEMLMDLGRVVFRFVQSMQFVFDRLSEKPLLVYHVFRL